MNQAGSVDSFASKGLKNDYRIILEDQERNTDAKFAQTSSQKFRNETLIINYN
jgi:hypothetical protein